MSDHFLELRDVSKVFETDEGEMRAVVGSPHFFVEGWGAFCPVLDIERVGGELQMKVDDRAMDEFFVSALEE